MKSFLGIYFFTCLCLHEATTGVSTAQVEIQPRVFAFRYIWDNRTLVSDVAKRLQAMQNSCSTVSNYRKYSINNYGLGSGLESLAKAMCNSYDAGFPLYVMPSKWVWNDAEFCDRQGNFTNPLECYFGTGIAATSCNLHISEKQQQQYWIRYKCPKLVIDDGDVLEVFKFEGYFYEFLFQHINPAVVRLAEKAAHEVFKSKMSPENMITIHIRWGDKEQEMGGLVSIDTYVNAAYTLIKKHKLEGDISIFMSTESPRASKLFKKHPFVVKSKWKIFEYRKTISKEEGSTLAKRANEGPLGLHCIINILLAMESRFYVLTTASNWSTILAGLLNGVVQPECNNCADWIDLKFNRQFKAIMAIYNRNHRRNRNKTHHLYYPYNHEGMLLFPVNFSSTLLNYKTDALMKSS